MTKKMSATPGKSNRVFSLEMSASPSETPQNSSRSGVGFISQSQRAYRVWRKKTVTVMSECIRPPLASIVGEKV